MGMYTELRLGLRLKEGLPTEVVDVLKYMVKGEGDYEGPLPSHPLFSKESWGWMLNSDSYYFDTLSHSALEWDDITDCYFLSVQTNLKNYDDEIGSFIDWIKQYSESTGFVGHHMYEEEEHPNLIYF